MGDAYKEYRTYRSMHSRSVVSSLVLTLQQLY